MIVALSLHQKDGRLFRSFIEVTRRDRQQQILHENLFSRKAQRKEKPHKSSYEWS